MLLYRQMSAQRKVKYFLFCEHFSKDDTGRVSLNTIFDIVGDEKLPVVPPKFNIVFNVNIEDGDIRDGCVKFRIVLEDPQGKALVKVEALGEVAEAGNVVSNIPLDGKVPFSDKGQHIAKLFVNEKCVAKSSVEVVTGRPEDFKK